ncbi:MAG: leucine-rich repeat domain-containing protein [Ruminococcus sp.]|nr:leucine-rich repeat domain-containing protein [Ruminococcus sp.]
MPDSSSAAAVTSNLVFELGIRGIVNYVFTGKKYKNSVVIADIPQLAEYAFMSCSNLEEVTLGNGVNTIKREAFNGCYCLNSIDFGDTVTNIYESAFKACRNLSDVTFPESLVNIT